MANVKMIAEPWDLGMGGYQVGGFPTGWSEWNDQYRKTLRQLWRGEGHLIGDLARRMTGSSEQFQHDGRSPRASINHVTVHDGFTLADLVSYGSKHNEANGEDNRDGSDDNVSTNCGVEGDTDNSEILAIRRRLRANQLACLFLAQGVPLLLAGDEAANSQSGNNNTYCQDDQIGWIDWSKLGTDDDFTELVGQLTGLRQQLSANQAAPLGRRQKGGRLLRRQMADAHRRGNDRTGLEFSRRQISSHMYSPPPKAAANLVFIVLNGADEDVEITFPEWPNVSKWQNVLDTSNGLDVKYDPVNVSGHWASRSKSVLAFAGVP